MNTGEDGVQGQSWKRRRTEVTVGVQRRLLAFVGNGQVAVNAATFLTQQPAQSQRLNCVTQVSRIFVDQHSVHIRSHFASALTPNFRFLRIVSIYRSGRFGRSSISSYILTASANWPT